MSPEAALRLELRTSAALGLLTLAVHLAAAAVLLAFLPLAEGIAAAGLAALLGVAVTRDRGWPGSTRTPRALRLADESELTVELRGGAEIRGRLAAGRFVSRWLVVLELEGPHAGRRRLLVARDMLAPEGYRQLCLWALWDRLPAGKAADRRPLAVVRTISSDTCL